LSLDGRWFRR